MSKINRNHDETSLQLAKVAKCFYRIICAYDNFFRNNNFTLSTEAYNNLILPICRISM